MADIRVASQIILNDDETDKWPHPSAAALILAMTVLAMIMFGLAMLYSTSSGMPGGAALFKKQLLWAIIGIAGASVVYFIGYRSILKYAIVFIVITAILLIIARFGNPINGAYRWIQLGKFSIQPSEFAKLAVIIFLAHFCASKQRVMNSFIQGILPAACVSGFICALILLGKDLGTTALLVSTIWLMFFAVGVRLGVLLICPALIPCVFVYLKFMDPERWSRITSFMDPELVAKNSGYQLWNSLMALGSGFWTGLGFTQSRLKAMYLPEAHTDFILSIAGEELGYVALLLVIFCYLAIMFSAIYISIMAKDRQGMLLAFGIGAMITLQAIINIGVISGALPTKGIPAPFISYGGSNLLMSIISIGLLLSVAMDSRKNTPAKASHPQESEMHLKHKLSKAKNK